MQDEQREIRDFYQRPEDEQQAFLEQTWCDNCLEENLGMSDPQEYLYKGILFVEGRCKKCGEAVLTELTEEDF
ncbi:MAG: hypothetical protein OIF55_19955 [Amphritea sp.]|nr:hypothetical protein [Amphritea sp.]